MEYTLLIYQSSADFAARTDATRSDAFWGSFVPYMLSLYAAALLVAVPTSNSMAARERAEPGRGWDGRPTISRATWSRTR
jgi:hypothetical protein